MTPHLHDVTRVSIFGPTVKVSAHQAVGLSLAIYELATNAMKYGALSVPEGRIAIGWHVSEGNAFEFRWRERGGPAVTKPTRGGFGTRLTNRIVAGYFAGKGETRYDPEGVQYVLQGRIEDGTVMDAPAP